MPELWEIELRPEQPGQRRWKGYWTGDTPSVREGQIVRAGLMFAGHLFAGWDLDRPEPWLIPRIRVKARQ